MPLRINLCLSFLFLIILPVLSQRTDSSYAPKSWDKFQPGLRVGVGIQKSFYTELGFSMQKNLYEASHGFIIYSYYASWEWTPRVGSEASVQGIKIGGEIVNNGAVGAFEVKYLADDEKQDVVLTPKFGFGLGLVNIYYGYNLSTNKYPFPKIRKHQFSLVINTNMLYYHWRHKDE